MPGGVSYVDVRAAWRNFPPVPTQDDAGGGLSLAGISQRVTESAGRLETLVDLEAIGPACRAAQATAAAQPLEWIRTQR